jgi:hypothetical protein
MWDSNLSYEDMQKEYIERSKSARAKYAHLLVDIPVGTKGPWTVKKFNVPQELCMDVLRSMRNGRTVYAGDFTSLVHNSRGVVMSDTIAEIDDYMYFVRSIGRFAKINKTKVLINGLGLGGVPKAVLAFENVIQVDVVEIDKDVIDLVAPTYRSDPRVNIYHLDAYDVSWPVGAKWDFAWHDIWDGICSDNLEGMKKLHRKYGRRVKEEQGSWCRYECERQLR